MKIVKNIVTIDSTVLAGYILQKYGPMSHLKLQKLLYLVQGYHLAYFNGKPLIEDSFEAWVHGPVSRKIFNELRDKSILYDDISLELEEGEETPEDILKGRLSTTQIEVINEVLDMYASEKGITLEAITHKQAPWIKARAGAGPADKCENVISPQDMQAYFSLLLEN